MISQDNTKVIRQWMMNDEGLYDEVRILIRKAYDISGAAKAIRGIFEENAPDIPVGPYQELMTDALNSVDWTQLGEYFMSEWLMLEEESEEQERLRADEDPNEDDSEGDFIDID